MKITFPDGSKKEFEQGVTALDVANTISEGLMRATVAVKIDDILVDATLPIKKDCKLQLITFKDPEGVNVFRHSTAHVMAEAVITLFPEALPTIGPAVEEGFYYDFHHEPFKPEDLEKIEQKMKEIIKAKLPFERKELSKTEALLTFKNNKFKTELVKDLPDGEKITVYSQGGFTDLCRGPHIPHTGKIEAFKLTKIAGAYWKGNAANEQLQRIYGISFPQKKELKAYIEKMEEALKRDHRKIGKEMDLFSLHEEGMGFPFWHPKGTILYNIVKEYAREENKKRGYNEIMTPIILNSELWHKSGHWDNFKENMYFTKIDEQDYAIKPMNCPGGLLIYKSNVHSYRELPLRNAEFGYVHRH